MTVMDLSNSTRACIWVAVSVLAACGTPIDAPITGTPGPDSPGTQATIQAAGSKQAPLSANLNVRSLQEGSLRLHEEIVDPDPHLPNRTTTALVQYAAGLDTDAVAAVASAGVAQSDLGAAVVGGTAQYRARYNYVLLNDVAVDGGRITANAIRPSGDQTIFLDADFNAGTLTGSTFDLAVHGTVSGQTVGGSVIVTPQIGVTANGTLNGQIGTDGVAAVFVGKDDTSVVAGGLVGVRN